MRRAASEKFPAQCSSLRGEVAPGAHRVDQIVGGIDLPAAVRQRRGIKEVRFDHPQPGSFIPEVVQRKTPPVANDRRDFMAGLQQRLDQAHDQCSRWLP